MADPIDSVTEVATTRKKPNPRGEELRGEKLVRGVKAVVNVTVKRKNGKSDAQELRGTYLFTPDPHDNPDYNKRQPEFYLKAAQAAARAVTTGPDYALVPVDRFQFKFGKVTHLATTWEPPIGHGYKNRWQVDGDLVDG
ncbi:MAG: hypothetical protein HOV94_18970 [Saccharothrix sp.]|nr:hypothetical protein [Saccharothrix sp.]